MKILKTKTDKEIKIYSTTVEDTALAQIQKLGNFEAYQDSKIRIMPDCHAGMGCTIGTTMTIDDKITPNLVGVDIGCGMLTIKLKETDIDLKKLDNVINLLIPSGFNIHSKQQSEFNFDKLFANTIPKFGKLNIQRAELSLGSLGGGNHFIEVGKNSKDEIFIVIHSGSRNIGNQIANGYQNLAIKTMMDNSINKDELVAKLKSEGRYSEINEELKKLKIPVIDKELAYLTNYLFEYYMHDMQLMQHYAVINRRTIADIILEGMNLLEDYSFETIHNYIDFERMILRKGAVSAEKGETLLIPINMRDGSIIAEGKGNEDWNYSAPHGAGRLMGRNQAHKTLNLDTFKTQMEGIYSTSVSKETLDESPDAYKPMEEIIAAIDKTVTILDIIKPIYNFKAH